MSASLNQYTRLRQKAIFVGVSLAGILVAIDFTIVNICLPMIQQDFSVSTNTLQWLSLGFGITFASCQTAAGKLADILGRRKILYASIVIFILASFGAGLSSSILFLIVMRLFQGLAASAIFPSGIAILVSIFPANQQSRVVGIYGSMLGVGLAVGPMLGGLITHNLGWPWVFFMNIPLAMIALYLCAILGRLKESKHPSTPAVDWAGILSMILAIAGVCFLLSQAAILGWHSMSMWVIALVTMLAWTAFVFNLKNANHPVFPADLLSNRAFLLGSAVSVAVISIAWVVVFYTPLYLMQVLGYSIIQVALWLSIMTFMTVVMPGVAGYIYDKYSKQLITHMGFLASIVGLVLYTGFTVDTGAWLMVAAFGLFGFAWGIGNGIATPIALLAVKGHEDAGVISGGVLTILNVVGTLFVAVATKIFTMRESSVLLGRLNNQQIHLDPEQLYTVKAWLADPEQSKQLITSLGHTMADKVLAQFHASFVSGFTLMFLFFAMIAALLYIVSFRSIQVLWREEPR